MTRNAGRPCCGAVSPARIVASILDRRTARGLLWAVAVAGVPLHVVAGQTTYSPRRCIADTTATPATAPLTTADTVAPGVTYRCLYRPEGPWALHVATVDLRAGRYDIDGARAMGGMFGRERVSAIAARLAAAGRPPVVAINADFFDLQTGEVENNHVVGGEWVKGAMLTDSPHDEFDNAHTQFAIDRHGRPLIARFALRGEAVHDGRRQALVGINYRPPRSPGLVLYTSWYGTRTPHDTLAGVATARPQDPDNVPRGAARDTAPPRPAPSISQLRADSARVATLTAIREAVEVQLTETGRAGDTLIFHVVSGDTTRGGNTPIAPRGAVLSATGPDASAFVRGVALRGGELRVVARLIGDEGDGNNGVVPYAAVGGWPRLVQDGRNVGAYADSLEGTFPRFSTARHPRSAIALSRDSTTLMLVVVDGRRRWSEGMSLGEFADALISLGAFQAMNLDGGGSSALWVKGTVVNYPSDPTGERTVGNALVVIPKP